MEIEKPTDDKLIEQIKNCKIYFYFFGFMGMASALGYFVTEYLGWLVILILFMNFAIAFDSQIYYDKIRLEIRELKKVRRR